MKSNSKTCAICSKPTENAYPLCKNCWLACKLLEHSAGLCRKAASYCKKLRRRKIREIQNPVIPPKWKSAKEKADWYKIIKAKTDLHFKSEDERRKRLKKIERKIRAVRNGVILD